MRLTDLTLRSLSAPERGPVTHVDDDIPGFGLRVSQGGTKTFVLVYGKARKRVTIGRYPFVSLAKAREKAKNILAEHQLNGDAGPSLTFDEARRLFLSLHSAPRHRARTKKEVERLLTKHFTDLETMKLTDIAASDIMAVTDTLLLKTPSAKEERR